MIWNGGRRLFAVFRQAQAPQRAAVLVCPPFFHEHFLSYRLLSQIAERLAANGISTLRFDYYGAGDSDGDSREFTLDGAIADTDAALDALRARVGGVPIYMLGARSGAWPAAKAATQNGFRLWLWQPVADGAEWLEHLERLDAKERGSRSRYPLIGSATKPADEGHLVGYVCAAPLRNAIADTRLADIIASAPVPVDVIADAADPPFAAAAREFRLPENVAHWHGGADMQAIFFTKTLAAIVDELAGVVPQPGAS